MLSPDILFVTEIGEGFRGKRKGSRFKVSVQWNPCLIFFHLTFNLNDPKSITLVVNFPHLKCPSI
jgi:hypothetical protein